MVEIRAIREAYVMMVGMGWLVKEIKRKRKYGEARGM